MERDRRLIAVYGRGEGDAPAIIDDLGQRLVARSLLEGDFVLRSGKPRSTTSTKYRFETDPDLLRALGERLAEVVRERSLSSAASPDKRSERSR